MNQEQERQVGARGENMIAPAFSNSYAKVYDLFHNTKRYSEEVAFVLSLLKEESGSIKSVIDFACGTGPHLIEFQKRGLEIHGNDLSQGMLDRAKVQLESSGVNAYTLSHSPMQNLSLGKGIKFDLGVCFYTGLGYLVEPEELQQFFCNLRSIIRPGGYFFCDLWNGQRMAKDFSPYREKTVESAQMRLKRTSTIVPFSAQNALKVHFDFELTVLENGAKTDFCEEHIVRYHTLPEMENICIANGFRMVSAGPFFDESCAVENAWNFYLLAQFIPASNHQMLGF